MINLMVLAIWSGTGVVIAAALTGPSEPNWAWAPLAVVFGPLWILIATEQRDDSHRVEVTEPPAFPAAAPIAERVDQSPVAGAERVAAFSYAVPTDAIGAPG